MMVTLKSGHVRLTLKLKGCDDDVSGNRLEPRRLRQPTLALEETRQPNIQTNYRHV
jgi:hypothetical protein